MDSRSEETSASNAPPSNVAETMARLSGKPGVKATMLLDRSQNTVVQTSGSFSSFRPLDNPRASVSSTAENGSAKEDGVEEFAAMIWNFVNSAAGLVHDLDAEDDMKLLRLRTKKHEFLILPDPRYIFIVVTDSPPA